MANTIAGYDDLERLWREKELLLEIKRNFSWMAERGLLSPLKFHLVRLCPAKAMAAVLSFLGKGIFVFPHWRKAQRNGAGSQPLER